MNVNYSQQLGLGQFNPTGRAQQYQQNAQNMRFNDQAMEMRGFQQEQNQLQANKQQTVDDNIQGALDGSVDSMRALWQANPKLGETVQRMDAERVAKRGAEQAEVVKKKTTSFMIEYKNASPERRKELEVKALADPDIDWDDEDAHEQVRNGNGQIIDLALYSLMGDKAYEQFYSGNNKAKFEQGTGKMQGFAFNPDNGEYSVNPELKVKLDEAALEPDLDAKSRQGINKDITQLTNNTKMISNTTKSLMALSKITDKDGYVSGPASIAMVFKFMKALDPTSVVREGEFATAENSAGVDDKIRNAYNKLMEGGRLGKKQVAEFLETAKGIANSAIDSSTTEVDKYLNTFESTLPKSFVKLIKERQPERFDMPEPTSTSNNNEDNSGKQKVATGPNGQKAILINGKWVVQ